MYMTEEGRLNIMGDTCALSALTLVSSSASVLGGICLLVTHYKIKALHYGLRNILCFLTISDILTSSGYIVGATNSMIESSGGKYSDVVCKAQSFLTTFSNLASFSWTSMIAVHLYHGLGQEEIIKSCVPYNRMVNSR